MESYNFAPQACTFIELGLHSRCFLGILQNFSEQLFCKTNENKDESFCYSCFFSTGKGSYDLQEQPFKVLYKIGALKIFAEFTVKPLHWSLLDKVITKHKTIKKVWWFHKLSSFYLKIILAIKTIVSEVYFNCWLFIVAEL